MIAHDAPICPILTINSCGEHLCQGKDCAWFNDDAGLCAMAAMGAACTAAVNLADSPFTGSKSSAGIIVKCAPLAGDFAETEE